MRLHRLVLVVPALAVCFVAVACSQPVDSGSGEEIAALNDQISDLVQSNKRLENRLGKAERRLDGHAQDLASLGRRSAEAATAVNVAPSGDGEGEASMDGGADTAAVSGELASLLTSEEGREVVEKAMKSIQDKEREERTNRFATMMLDRFASEANLSADQTERMQTVVTAGFGKIRDVWTSMRDTGGMNADERATLMEDNRAKMEEIRTGMNDEVKGILNADQYLIYEEQSSRMRGFGGGGGGNRRGGNGGR